MNHGRTHGRTTRKHIAKCFRAVDFPRLCRGRKKFYFTCNHGYYRRITGKVCAEVTSASKSFQNYRKVKTSVQAVLVKITLPDMHWDKRVEMHHIFIHYDVYVCTTWTPDRQQIDVFIDRQISAVACIPAQTYFAVQRHLTKMMMRGSVLMLWMWRYLVSLLQRPMTLCGVIKTSNCLTRRTA